MSEAGMKGCSPILWCVLGAALIAVFFLSLGVGRFAIAPGAVWDILVSAALGSPAHDMLSLIHI